jgi:hypothetical protein
MMKHMADKAAKHAGGRPTKFEARYCKQAYEACARLGAIDDDLAALFGVSVRTIAGWKLKHDEFLQATKKGKDEYDSDVVERALRDRALGFDYEEEVMTRGGPERITKRFTGDTTAAIFWLKNRQPDRWRDKHVRETEGGVTVQVTTGVPRKLSDDNGA